MNQKKKIIVPIVLVGAFVMVTALILKNPPTAKRGKPQFTPTISVETIDIKNQPFVVNIDSYGSIRPRTQSQLVAQTSGQVIEINSNFREGGFFEKDEVLLVVDDREFLAEKKIAEANLITAKQDLLEEEARATQALEDWKNIGKGEKPNALVLREPQVASAKARVLSAEANLDKAVLRLERTKIKAPYAGRVLSKNVDVGQVVNNNSVLANIYAIDTVEVRLPIRNKDLPYVRLPENNRQNELTSDDLPDVTITSSLGNRSSWQGKIVRTEGAIDSNSQQLYVVAQIDDPFGKNMEGKEPLKIGQYVTAKIEGKTLSNSVVVPNKTIYQGTYVYLVVDDKLKRQNVQVGWQNNDFSIIESGLSTGDDVVKTALGQVNSGTLVRQTNGNAQSKKGGRYAEKRNKREGGKNRQGKPEGKRKKPENGNNIAKRGGTQ